MSRTRVFIIDPNENVREPYNHVEALYTVSAVNRYTSIEQAKASLDLYNPTIIFLSTSYSPTKQFEFLSALKLQMTDFIVPLIFVVNWKQRMHTLLGVEWGAKVGIAHSFSTKEEVMAMLRRVTD